INRELAKIDSSFAGIAASARNFLGIFGVGLGVGGLAMMARDALDAAGGLGEMAEQLGITTDMLQVMQFAASQAGVKAQELEAGFMKFASVVGEAAQGEKTAIEAFNRLGVKILDQNGKL